MTNVAIVNYGIGNLRSIERAFLRAGATAIITDDPEVIANASHILLPGVGHFQACVDGFNASGLREVVEDHVKAGEPLLGICVGMQMMFDRSDEGDVKGLGWIKGQVRKFPNTYEGNKLNVPHVGMGVVSSKKSILFEGIDAQSRFYFTHSYRVESTQDKNIAGLGDYGGIFVAAAQKGRIYGTQFHPEKSHRSGIALLKNFVEQG